MKTILLALSFLVGMISSASAQGKVNDSNEQITFTGFGWFRFDNNNLEGLYGIANHTQEDLEIRVSIKELSFDSTVVVPAFTTGYYSLGMNTLTNVYEELPQLHITLISEDPGNYFALRFTYWGRQFNQLKNKPTKSK